MPLVNQYLTRKVSFRIFSLSRLNKSGPEQLQRFPLTIGPQNSSYNTNSNSLAPSGVPAPSPLTPFVVHILTPARNLSATIICHPSFIFFPQFKLFCTLCVCKMLYFTKVFQFVTSWMSNLRNRMRR